MKRLLPILVDGWWFVVCCLIFFFVIQPLTTYHLPVTSPAFAQTPITFDQSFAGTVYLVEDPTFCGGRVDLVNPKQQEVLAYTGEQKVAIGKIGPFAAGSELIFSLTPNLPCAERTFFSNNSDDAYVEKMENQENLWGIAWFVDGQDKPVIMFVGLVPAELTPPTHHPAIFIHGLGGRPTDWTTGDKKVYFDLLKADPYNYPEDYLVAYAYADADGNTETYDYQGDVTKISADLVDYVDKLSKAHIADGGDGKVDLVGFSLGGLVARQYLNAHSADHKIRKVITIASPHEGLSILTPEAWAESLPFFGQFIKKAFLSFLNNFLLGLFVNPGSEQPVSFESPAAQQLVPNNSFLQWLNDRGLIPTSLSYSALCGDIDARFRQKVFFFTLEKSVSIGDGIVPKESALGIPVDDLTKICFSDEALFDIRVAKSGTSYEYVIDPINFSDVRFRHSELIVQPEVVEEVIGILTAED